MDYYKLIKKEQVSLLKEFGLTSSEIRKLRNEKLRVEKLIELEPKPFSVKKTNKIDKRNKYGLKKRLYGNGFRIL